jgi:hypothetical protein
MPLTAIVGDVHGCAAELEDLLGQIGFAAGKDRLVLVGDLVARGPDSRGVLALVRRLGARAARGNHDDKLIAWRRRSRSIPAEHERIARALSEADWETLEAMPLWIDLPEHRARVVHAGVVPGVPIDRVPADALLKMRTLDGRGRWSDEPDGGALWGERYEGPPHVIFGHYARSQPQFHSWATGIDTGCVYGGRLTAAVLAAGEPVPRGDGARAVLRSVKARRAYSLGKGGGLGR